MKNYPELIEANIKEYSYSLHKEQNKNGTFQSKE